MFSQYLKQVCMFHYTQLNEGYSKPNESLGLAVVILSGLAQITKVSDTQGCVSNLPSGRCPFFLTVVFQWRVIITQLHQLNDAFLILCTVNRHFIKILLLFTRTCRLPRGMYVLPMRYLSTFFIVTVPLKGNFLAVYRTYLYQIFVIGRYMRMINLIRSAIAQSTLLW